nr:MAG TPA: hypothetical protein [Caudoviricetes sp.]
MPFSFRSPAGGTYAAKDKKSLTSSTKVPLVRLNVVSALFQTVSWRFDRFFRMKSPRRASCSNKRATGFPASLSVARFHIHPYGNCSITAAIR